MATARIVVGIDGSPASGAALEWAANQAEITGARLEAVIAWEWPSGYGWPLPLPEDFDPAADAGRALDEALGPVRKAHPLVALDPRVVSGHPATALVEASRGADLLVVGSRGHGAFSGMLIGSVSEHCATHAHCPVVVFRGPRH